MALHQKTDPITLYKQDTNTHTYTYTQMAVHQKQWNDPFTWNEANMWCGMIGWLAISLQILTSLPFIRRKFFETFYWSHMNFKFLALVSTLRHFIGRT